MIFKAFLLSILFTYSVSACSIVGPWPTACAAYSTADLIITGDVTKIVPGGVMVEPDRVYKGIAAKQVIVEQHGTSCDRDFSRLVGKKLLLYLIKNPSAYTYYERGYLSGGELSQSADDINWLDKLPDSLDRTRVSGFLSVVGKNVEDIKYLADTDVNIIGKKGSYTTKTDKSGYFQLWNLPYDNYRLKPTVPINLTRQSYYPYGRGNIGMLLLQGGDDTYGFTLSIEAGSARCGRIDYTFTTNK